MLLQRCVCTRIAMHSVTSCIWVLGCLFRASSSSTFSILLSSLYAGLFQVFQVTQSFCFNPPTQTSSSPVLLCPGSSCCSATADVTGAGPDSEEMNTQSDGSLSNLHQATCGSSVSQWHYQVCWSKKPLLLLISSQRKWNFAQFCYHKYHG